MRTPENVQQLTFAEAIEQLKKGKKVKLPDWGGYWFMITTASPTSSPMDNIRVMTKDGDVLDTPWVDKYKTRNDWEVTNGDFGFDFVILSIQNGKHLRRPAWPAGQRIALIGAKDYQINVELGKPLQMSYLAIIGPDTIEPYNPTQSDMLAKDWIPVYQPEPTQA